ncbi:hypothetical protein POX_c04722 [Penicillium oxalicum]|uniref:hypothetical protein n=1 Tax=Penicillium oxalicum TaxID=69781 RepID=UPI0020B74284|nr:hypothetical protein POX_c04722 [Penicillium oxalicum]KAI2791843.1 hypothetical protein POX_c04722 [Penicillium oxalicum]
MVDANRSKAPGGSDAGNPASVPTRDPSIRDGRLMFSSQMECVKRNIGHLCTKDERQARAKRSKTEHKDKPATKTDLPSNGEDEAEAEETIQLLEHFVAGTPHPNVPVPGLVGPAPSSVAPDFPNRYWLSNDPRRHGEKLALIQEIVDAMPELETVYALFEVFVTRCQGPLGNVVHTPTFSKQAEQLGKCLSLASPDSRVLAISGTVTMEALGCYLLALVLGLAFHPTPSVLGWAPTPSAMRVEELRASDIRSKTWRSLSLRCLQDGVSLFCGSITGLQAAVMLLLDGQESSLALDAILVTAISGARKLGLHRLGDFKLNPSASSPTPLGNGTPEPVEPLYIRTEVGVRIWWALVLRDWSRGQALGYYTIRPTHFNTRMPLHINDDDLCLSTWRVNAHGDVTERPRSEFTMMSYTIHAIELGGIVRESIDIWGLQTQQSNAAAEPAKWRKHLNNKYEKYVAGLPSHFRLGSSVGLTAAGPLAAIPVQRWMLHQQLWSFLLRLHRATLSSPIGRASCQLLAQNIIGTQAQIQARCTVCGSLSTSEVQLFNAAVVLLLDLIFTSEQEGADSASAHLSRLMTRDKIREAIELLRTKSMTEGSRIHDLHSEQIVGSAQRSVDTLEALMKLEEGEPSHTAANQTEDPLAAKPSLRAKVTAILSGLSGRADPVGVSVQGQQTLFDPFSPFDVSTPLANVGDGFHDLDVLPILSNGYSPDFYQYFDFLTPQFEPQPQLKEAPYTTLGDLTGPLGLGTLQFASPYSSVSGTRMTHTSASSLQSEPIGLGGDSDSATTPSSADAYVAAKFYHAMGDGALAPM